VPGHHGTRAEWADQIAEEGFQPSTAEDDWLGCGSYFFEDAPQMAEEWAEMMHPEHEICVFEAEISLSRCLDLLNGEGQDLVEPFYDRYIRLKGKETVAQLKQRESDAYGDFDGDVINLACQALAEEGLRFDVVRAGCRAGGAIFEDKDKKLPRSRFDKREHVQLAVRNDCAILGFRRKELATGKSRHHGA